MQINTMYLNRFKTKEVYLEYYRKYRLKNRKKLRDYNRKYNKEYRKKNGYKNEEASTLKYPEKERARRILRNALRSNKRKTRVVKKSCDVCRSQKSQAHHPDYSKPLEVVWLCALHHKKLHAS